MGWYGVSCDDDVTRGGCGDRFCLEGGECDTAMWCCAMRALGYEMGREWG